MITVTGTKKELNELKKMLKLKSLCPFGVRENVKRCMEMKNCATCINTNIKWEVEDDNDQNDRR